MEPWLLRGFVGHDELGGQGLYEIGLVPKVCRYGLFDEVFFVCSNSLGMRYFVM